MPQLFAGLTAQPFDAAAFLVQPITTMGPQVFLAQGELCAKATNRAACDARVAGAMDQSKFPFKDDCGPMYGTCTRYVVTTLGDEVRQYQSRDGMLQLLGPIDTAQDALLLLFYDKHKVLCSNFSRQPPFAGIEPASVREIDGAFEMDFVSVQPDCSGGSTRERVGMRVTRDGAVTETGREKILPPMMGCPGRRPAGLQSRHVAASRSALGEHFAQMAHLEHASIAAFEMLAAELRQHGAPLELIEAAHSAAADEVRHTAITSELARAFGGTARASEVARHPVRSLEAIAIENAVEGCVRECFGAALGCYQAQSALDPTVAAAMSEIAEDETRHAALAFAVDAWLWQRLDVSSRARVTAARAQAVRDLRDELSCDCDPTTRPPLGLPDATAALRICSALERSVWIS